MRQFVSDEIIDVLQDAYDRIHKTGAVEVASVQEKTTFLFGEQPKAAPPGIVFCTERDENGRLLVHRTRGLCHSLCVACTGGGKTEGFVFSNIYNADPSLSYVIADVKGELCPATYHMMCEKYGKENVHIFNFRDPFHTQHYFNPFQILAERFVKSQTLRGKEKKREISKIVSDNNKAVDSFFRVTSQHEPQWEIAAKTIIAGHLLSQYEDCCKSSDAFCEGVGLEKTIRFFEEELSWTAENDDWGDNNHFRERPDSSIAKRKAKGILGSSSKATRTSYLSTVETMLRDYHDPSTLEIMKANTFDPRSLGEKPQVVYVIYDMADEGMKDVISAFFVHILNELHEEYRRNQRPLAVPVVLLLDEFPMLAHHAIYPSLLATGRGMGIFLELICQSEKQLTAVYQEQAEVMRENCNLKFFLNTNHAETARLFQEEVGKARRLSKGDARNGVLCEVEAPRIELDKLLFGMRPGECYVKLVNMPIIHSSFTFAYKTPEYHRHPLFDVGSVCPLRGEKRSDAMERGAVERGEGFQRIEPQQRQGEEISEEVEDALDCLRALTDNELDLVEAFIGDGVISEKRIEQYAYCEDSSAGNIIKKLSRLGIAKRVTPTLYRFSFSKEIFRKARRQIG